MSRVPRAFHRTLGVSLALPLVVWAVTGLLFHVKHRYAEAYESLRVPTPVPDLATARLAPADLASRSLVDAGTTPRLAAHPSGRLAWIGAKGGRTVAFDAATGEAIGPADDLGARSWAERAVAASPNASRYGAITSSRTATRRSSLSSGESPALRFGFSGAKVVTVDLLTGEVEQTGALNDYIDATYKLHYLQWTPWKGVNVALVLVAIPALLLLALTGFRLFVAGAWQDRRP